jgi:hypothetical protein
MAASRGGSRASRNAVTSAQIRAALRMGGQDRAGRSKSQPGSAHSSAYGRPKTELAGPRASRAALTALLMGGQDRAGRSKSQPGSAHRSAHGRPRPRWQVQEPAGQRSQVCAWAAKTTQVRSAGQQQRRPDGLGCPSSTPRCVKVERRDRLALHREPVAALHERGQVQVGGADEARRAVPHGAGAGQRHARRARRGVGAQVGGPAQLEARGPLRGVLERELDLVEAPPAQRSWMAAPEGSMSLRATRRDTASSTSLPASDKRCAPVCSARRKPLQRAEAASRASLSLGRLQERELERIGGVYAHNGRRRVGLGEKKTSCPAASRTRRGARPAGAGAGAGGAVTEAASQRSPAAALHARVLSLACGCPARG